MKDDGFGIHLIKRLEKEVLPDNLILVDGGTSTINMLGYFLDYKNIIIVDAVKLGFTPGTLYKIDPNDLKNYKNSNVSIHDVQILDVLAMAKLTGADPEVIIYGVEPYEIGLGMELSSKIKEKIPEIIKELKKQLDIFKNYRQCESKQK